MKIYVVLGIDATGEVFQLEAFKTQAKAEAAKKVDWVEVIELDVLDEEVS